MDLSSLNDEIGDLFEVKGKASKPAQNDSSKPAKKEKISLVGSERAKNVAIRISQFKSIGLGALVDLLMEMDPSQKLSVEQLEALIRSVPTSEERALLNAYPGDRSMLTEVEKFFFGIMEVPKIDGRLKTLRVSRLFGIEIDILSKQVQQVNTAALEVINCSKLGGVFELVLALGNTLNHQKANGFRISALLKLVETKSNKQEITMLHYLASVIETRMKDLDGFIDEMPTVKAAANINVEQITSNFGQLQSLVHDATVASGLVVPEVLAALTSEDNDESPGSIRGKMADAGPAERYASELYIGANAQLAQLEEDTVTMIQNAHALQSYLVEYELQVHEIFVILSSFFKAYDHVKQQNQEKREQAQRAEKFKSLKKTIADVKDDTASRPKSDRPHKSGAKTARVASTANREKVGVEGSLARGAALFGGAPTQAKGAPGESIEDEPLSPFKNVTHGAASSLMASSEGWGPSSDGGQF